jgi:hypothetical protein
VAHRRISPVSSSNATPRADARISLSREERDALWQFLAQGEDRSTYIELGQEAPEESQRKRRTLEAAFRLLDGIGWACEGDRERYDDIPIDRDDLLPLMAEYAELAAACLQQNREEFERFGIERRGDEEQLRTWRQALADAERTAEIFAVLHARAEAAR